MNDKMNREDARRSAVQELIRAADECQICPKTMINGVLHGTGYIVFKDQSDNSEYGKKTHGVARLCNCQIAAKRLVALDL